MSILSLILNAPSVSKNAARIPAGTENDRKSRLGEILFSIPYHTMYH
ncbi:hypothetical protein AB434_2517 [Heyndrickxia coagulans]|uniref:Uncharacterized protein n=1 Tax=Heyndrickxia coagulans TaxID=1398 RepID=A0AAN0WCK3_HEYCO|nr:hypothetical protein SB48_HM08orf04440 [Heyndrickxia coagulans]AKN54922.1 hypothetical protein AB434_2517 [Heyndrickxia coagulans]KYC63535.1 hypothetical protein B4100_0186 [Heyndrickxia coagulans]KYC90474.1 hypothetical protein B4096_0138 [Heyndrickxia coagulans]